MSEHSELKNYQGVLFPILAQWTLRESIISSTINWNPIIIYTECSKHLISWRRWEQRHILKEKLEKHLSLKSVWLW